MSGKKRENELVPVDDESALIRKTYSACKAVSVTEAEKDFCDAQWTEVSLGRITPATFLGNLEGKFGVQRLVGGMERIRGPTVKERKPREVRRYVAVECATPEECKELVDSFPGKTIIPIEAPLLTKRGWVWVPPEVHRR